MPYYDIHIKGSGGTQELRSLFENDFESTLKQKAGGGHRVTYSWGPGGELPGGLQKVLDIIAGATPASGAGHPTTDQLDLPPAKNDDVRPPVDQGPVDSTPNQNTPEQVKVAPTTQAHVEPSAQVQQATCVQKKLDVVV